MLDTKPVYGDNTHLGCSRISFRFKEAKIPQQNHHLGDAIGAQLMLFNYSPIESAYTVVYINEYGMVLKRVSYSREGVLEVDISQSVCRVVAIPTKPPLKVVP